MNRPPEQPSWDELHYRLVSLWELMMQLFGAGKFFKAYHSVSNLGQMLLSVPAPTLILTDRDHNDLCSQLDALAEELSAADLTASTTTAREILQEVKTKGRASRMPDGRSAVQFPTESRLRLQRSIQDLNTLVKAEFASRHVLIMPAAKSALYSPSEPLFGAEVATRFSADAAWEIEEAGRCLALSLDTASVFHLMRAMEVALEAIRICLQLPQPLKPQDKAWGTILDNYRKELEKRNNPQHARQWKSAEDKEFFVDLRPFLEAVKDGWRNKTMHVEKTYTPAQAEHVFVVVRGFMQKVASRLDEDGQPLA